VFFLRIIGLFRRKNTMFSSNLHDQITIEVSQGGYLAINIESFLIDRQSAGLSRHSIRFYRNYLNQFVTYCNANSLNLIQNISSDYLRRYFLAYSETHNPGGVHGLFRTLRAFFHWLTNEEVMPFEWKDPMQKVKPPKVFLEPLEPISIENIKTLIITCQNGQFTGERDRAIFLALLGSVKV
jgi:site-specific recombinase XerD